LFLACRRSDPEAIEQIIASGRSRDLKSRQIAAACVALLMRAESSEVRHAA
jgi:hypothetical protein